ncbi:hydroxymethylglutaryl-CoA lyase [Fulvivirgaceae bacterium BMA10]|uniref:Hydroxymethylglutaryl-CoA lyase n=1 Tax=Splendidivirga corallicola TaxID=3051826 RepID=A0ABT8KGD3_9BACT|nr:hydroxymethylglutaryl-CoA lyase [Fulvivirgaceae bacterium BMA10]
MVKIIECPRDAMQGMETFVPTQKKTDYINHLLQVGFDTIDFGSFVSPKAIPQMKDTIEVLKSLELTDTRSKLLAIVANVRGAQDASEFKEITYLGFPLSVSETFQQRNTNKSIEQAMDTLAEIQDICQKQDKILVTYLSMGFGNPYGDPYDESVVEEFVDKLVAMEVKIISLADTIGVSNSRNITNLFTSLVPRFPQIEFGAHLHSNPNGAMEKIESAYLAGCKRFDGAIRGFGGCPMAKDDLVGNIATETIIHFFNQKKVNLKLDMEAFDASLRASMEVFH